MGRCCSIVAGYRRWVGADGRFAGVDFLTGAVRRRLMVGGGLSVAAAVANRRTYCVSQRRATSRTNNVANGSLVEPRRTELRASGTKSSTPMVSRKRETFDERTEAIGRGVGDQ